MKRAAHAPSAFLALGLGARVAAAEAGKPVAPEVRELLGDQEIQAQK